MKTFYFKDSYATTILSLLIVLYCFIANAQTTSKDNYGSNRINPNTGNAFPFNVIDSTNVVPTHPVNTPVIPYTPSPPDPSPPSHPNSGNQAQSVNGDYLTLTSKSTGGDPSGIENNVLQATDLKIYPNPSDGRFTLQFNLNTEGEINIHLTDILGKEIINHSYTGDNFNYTDQFDLSAKGKGLYMLSIEQNSKQLMKKVIVN